MKGHWLSPSVTLYVSPLVFKPFSQWMERTGHKQEPQRCDIFNQTMQVEQDKTLHGFTVRVVEGVRNE